MKNRILHLWVIALAAVLLLAMPVCALAGTDVTVKIGGTYNYGEANAVVELINQNRLAEGLGTVKMDPELCEAAMQRAAEISVYYSHTRPSGNGWYTISNRCSAENIAMGQRSAAAVMEAWMNSPGHRANILGGAWEGVGVGCFRQGDGNLCWVQLFGGSVKAGYNQTGSSYKTAIPVEVDSEVLILYINETNVYNGSEFGGFPGMEIPMDLKLGNAGWEYADPVELSGGYEYSFSGSCASIESGVSRLKMLSVGTGTLNVRLGGAVTVPVTVKVHPNPVLSLSYDEENNPILSWTGEGDYDLYYSLGSAPYNVYADMSAGSYSAAYNTIGLTYTYRLMASTYDTLYSVSNPVSVIRLRTPYFSTGNDGEGNIVLTVTETVPGASGYKVYRCPEGSSEYSYAATITGLTYTDELTPPGESCSYKLYAVDEADNRSAYSYPRSAVAKLRAPAMEGEVVQQNGGNVVRLSWNAVQAATGYRIYRNTYETGYPTLLATVGNVTSYLDETVESGNGYYYKIDAVCDTVGADSPYSAAVCLDIHLPAPRVTAEFLPYYIKLSWEEIPNAYSYYIYRSEDGGVTYAEYDVTTYANQYIDWDVSIGQTFYYKVYVDTYGSGYESDFSEPVSATWTMDAPTLKTKYTAGEGVELSWNAVEGAQAYEIFRHTQKKGEYTSLGTTREHTFTDTTAKPGTIMYYKVRALGSGEDSYSDYSAVKTVTLKLAKPVVTLSNVSTTGKIKLTWPKVEGALRYEIYRRVGTSGSFTLLTELTKRSYTDNDTTAGVRYFYKVRAVCANTKANSDYSAIRNLVADLPRTTATLSIVASTGKVKVTWNPVEGATSYEVARATSKSGPFTVLKRLNKTTWTDTTAEAGVNYYYLVRSLCGSVSDAASASPVRGIVCHLGQPSVKISNVAATGKVKLTWKAIPDADKYEVYRSTTKTGTYKKVKTLTGLSFTDTAGTAGTKYFYRVRAVCSANRQANVDSVLVNATVDLAQPVPSIKLKNKKPCLTWDEVDGAVKYEIYRATSQNGTYKKIKTVTATTFTNTDARKGTTYYYKVRAVMGNSAAASAYSKILSITSK